VHDENVETDEHPLIYLLHLNGWSATDYLTRLDAVHRRLGYGPICKKERKRVTRWTRYGVTPEPSAQKAMAALHGIPEEEITARPWPEWLKLSCLRERQLLDAEWNAQTTIELLDRVAATGGPMDRRGFLIVTGMTPVLAGAATAQPATARAHGRRIGKATPVLFDKSLAILRRQDDQLGSGQVHASTSRFGLRPSPSPAGCRFPMIFLACSSMHSPSTQHAAIQIRHPHGLGPSLNPRTRQASRRGRLR
jgi:hypothetical protein